MNAHAPHLPPAPGSFYIALCLFDLRRDPFWRRIVWGCAFDGPATWDDVGDAIADKIDAVRAICHPQLGFRVLHIDGPRAVDVTAQALEPFLTENDEPLGLVAAQQINGVTR